MRDLLLIGAGGHAQSVIDIIECKNEWVIKGLVGIDSEIDKEVLGYKIIASDKQLERLRKKYNYAFISIGQIKSSILRREIAEQLENLKFEYPNIISPFSVISKYSKIGCGNFIGHGAIVNASVHIKNQCIINSKSLLEHGVIVDSYCHISTGVILNGDVQIGEGSFIGSGSIIREGVKIPPNTTISAGSRIMGWPVKKKI